MPCCLSGLIGMPRGTFHHFSRQDRQQQAQACCATKTGWPRIGVCFPSFCGLAGASRMRIKSSQCRRIVSKPLSDMYFLSAAERRKRLRNFDLPSFRNAASNVRLSGMGVVTPSPTAASFALLPRNGSSAAAHQTIAGELYHITASRGKSDTHPFTLNSRGVAESRRGFTGSVPTGFRSADTRQSGFHLCSFRDTFHGSYYTIFTSRRFLFPHFLPKT